MDWTARIAFQRSKLQGFLRTKARWGRHSAAFVWVALCAWIAWVSLATAKRGADFGRYEAWGNALYDGDIFQIHSRVASPLGLPLSVHSAGPGMLISVSRAWFSGLSTQLQPDYVAFGLAAALTWWALIRLMLWLTSGNVPVVAFVAGVGFMGTHLGFYTSAYSSELASVFSLALLFYFAFASARIRFFEAVVIGITTGFSVVIRTQLVIYVAVPCAWMAYRLHQQYGRSYRVLLLAVVAALPCLALLVEATYVNRWMTGSFLRTPYQFGDAQWQSVDFRHTEFLAVLFHPRHGLFTYHPLYFVAMACALYIAVTAQRWHERCLASAAIGIVLLHLSLQAAWFCWWLGTGTFGMRGMATIAVLVLPALAVVLDRRQRAGKRIWPLVAACGLSSAWGLLLYFLGQSNFNTWPEVLRNQAIELSRPHAFVPVLVAACLTPFAWSIARRRPSSGLGALAAAAVSLALAASATDWLERTAIKSPHRAPSEVPWILAGMTALAFLLAFTALVSKPTARPTSRFAELAMGAFVLAVVATASVQFSRLKTNTEAYLRAPNRARHSFEVTSAVLWDEIEASYREYLVIPGFEVPKLRFKAYLERHNEEWAFVRRPDRLRHGRPRAGPKQRPAASSAPIMR